MSNASNIASSNNDKAITKKGESSNSASVKKPSTNSLLSFGDEEVDGEDILALKKKITKPSRRNVDIDDIFNDASRNKTTQQNDYSAERLSELRNQ